MIQTLSLTKAIALCWTALALISIGVKPTLAQTNEPTYQRNEKGTFGNSSTGDINPLDLINRVRVSPSRSAEQFNEDTGRQLEDAAAKFKREREQLLLNSPTTGSDTEKDSQ